MLIRKRLLTSAAWVALAGRLVAGPTVSSVEQAPPSEVPESIRAVLSASATLVSEQEEARFTFWFRSEMPLRSLPTSASRRLSAIPETALVGVVRVHDSRRDYRDDRIRPGIYTMRYARQPQDGAHLGTSEYPYFLVLTPVARDAKLDGLSDYRTLVDASLEDTATGHPVILSLRPLGRSEGEFPRLTEPADDHHAVAVKLAASDPEGAKGDLVFHLVFEGMGEF